LGCIVEGVIFLLIGFRAVPKNFYWWTSCRNNRWLSTRVLRKMGWSCWLCGHERSIHEKV